MAEDCIDISAQDLVQRLIDQEVSRMEEQHEESMSSECGFQFVPCPAMAGNSCGGKCSSFFLSVCKWNVQDWMSLALLRWCTMMGVAKVVPPPPGSVFSTPH